MTLVGIAFALVLILVQVGLFLNFVETSANVVDHSGADLWVSAPDIPHVNAGTRLPAAFRWKALEVPGVASADRYVLAWVAWLLPSGSQELVMCIGYPIDSGLGGPWNVTQGSEQLLKAPGAVMVDELYLDKLGTSGVGAITEISGRKAKVVGLTRGIRSFTTAPYVFTSFKNSLDFAPALISEDETIFLLIKVKPEYEISEVKAGLERRMPTLDVYTNEQMSWKTQKYWVFETGAGVTTLFGAVLGLLVGVVVVAQTIYAATVDHLREFGTLKAIGASNGRVYQVILTQAALSAVMGYLIAITLAKAAAEATKDGAVPVLLPPEAVAGGLLISLVMCMSASAISIRKATRIDPAIVFRS